MVPHIRSTGTAIQLYHSVADPMKRPTVLLADDHQVVLAAFARLLEPSCTVVGTVADGQALLTAAETLKPDLVLVDLGMPHLNGLDACSRLRERSPRTRIVVLTMNEDPDVAAEALSRGAAGYVLKSCPPGELFTAIDDVLAGRTYLTPAIACEPARVFAARVRSSRGTEITGREREVLQLLAEGKSMKEAAGILGVTARTIAFHKYTMMRRLNLRTGAQLVQHAVAIGIVSTRRHGT
jgi:DNA-binding NarL/FixJ family response regulator